MFLRSITMSEKTLKIDNIVVNKKEIHKSKQPISSDLVNYNHLKKKLGKLRKLRKNCNHR